MWVVIEKNGKWYCGYKTKSGELDLLPMPHTSETSAQRYVKRMSSVFSVVEVHYPEKA